MADRIGNHTGGNEKRQETFLLSRNGLPVLIIFLCAFLLHTVLNILMKAAPTVVIDEGLYTNIARSLAWKGELAFRGQPVNYPYLLYPMLLVPLYRIHRLLGGDIYRIIQIFNTLLITSSVFPAALFTLDFTGDKKKAYLAAFAAALMPDMLMGGYTMSECLLWPLALWMIRSGFRFFTERKLKYGLLTALFTGMMFAAKPGAVAVGAVVLAVFLLYALKERRPVRDTLLSFALLLGVIAAIYAVYLSLFTERSSIIGLYQKQTAFWTGKTILVALEAFFLMIFVWIFACGGICGLIPFVFWEKYEEPQRRFIIAAAAGLILSILGTAVFVVPFDWDDSLGVLPLHLRYTAMYIPVMFIFSLGINSFPTERKKAFAAVLTVFMLLSLFPGARAGFVKGGTTEFDSMALSAFTTTLNLDGDITGWILTILTVLFSLAVLLFYLTDRFSKVLPGICSVFFVFFVLFNAVCAHINTYIAIDPSIAADAREINELIGGTDCLGITQRDYKHIYSYWLDGRLNQPMQQVTVDQMFVQMLETGGIYMPFVPLEQSPNVSNHETPDTDRFVLGKTVTEHLELNDSVSVHKTDNGHFSFITIVPGTRWVDSMSWGLDGNELAAFNSGYIRIFDEDRSADGNLYLTVTASGTGSMEIEGHRIELSGSEKTFELTLPATDLIEIKAGENPIQILSFSTKK